MSTDRLFIYYSSAQMMVPRGPNIDSASFLIQLWKSSPETRSFRFRRIHPGYICWQGHYLAMIDMKSNEPARAMVELKYTIVYIMHGL